MASSQNVDKELDAEDQNVVERTLKPFVITDELLEKFRQVFSADLQKGLKKATNSNADMKCFPTYVSKLPSGKERGRYLVGFNLIL